MAYDRYPRAGERSGYNDRNDLSDYGQDYSGGDPYRYSSARDYAAAGEGGYRGGRDFGREDGRQRYGRDQGGDYGARNWGADRDQWRGQNDGSQSYGNQSYGGVRFGGQDDRNERYGRQDLGGRDDYRGERSFGGDRDRARDWGQDTYRQQRGTYDRQPQRYRDDDSDRGFLARAGDEVRSWFGDEEAERRRAEDARRDEPTSFRAGHDDHYHQWRNQQIAAFDRDYHEYRQENQSKFHNEFNSWRTERQGQRDLLNRVEEHAEVVGADGEHVGTVDKVRGDRIILTKSDADAGGHHHSIPSRWLQTAEGNRVTLRKTAAEAKQHWRDEERQQEDRGALFGANNTTGANNSGEQTRRGNEDGSATGGTNLNRSFSGTY